ncbi:MAG TPA: ParB/RepB/Spo0J family partition protein [Candidatus Hydrogenedentes bacterium]|nr:ParB/RepB/Spo0J family partition protein [Candidatus Hydrogenedentota bacterium]HOL77927.1 ParB/RepB/Spo0J family partition protein [Candidatus Hydrogenedentota bacterium]HPO87103.1 ParB/RepB/Spo0J family partition protein [Candidatus Hydrogenedentota bacterium]
MADTKKKVLGKGLEALLSPIPKAEKGTAAASEPLSQGERIIQLDPREIDPNPQQPRLSFREESLQELADSIRRDGVQEPVIVRRRNNKYELVTGERRVRAAIMADLPTVPAIVRDVSDADMLRLGIIENVQREDLNAIELAKAYQKLLEEFHWTQDELARQVGKSRVSVTNLLRLLHLPEDVQRHVADGELSMGHARALLALPSADAQRSACRKVLEKGLSVRETERLATARHKVSKQQDKDPNLLAIEEELRKRIGTKVSVRVQGKARGSITIEYYSLDDLDRILALFRR